MRAAFAACGNRSHAPAEDAMDWWRTWKDHDEPSLPRLVREADRRWRKRADDDHAVRVKERLARHYAAEGDLRARLGLPRAQITSRPTWQ